MPKSWSRLSSIVAYKARACRQSSGGKVLMVLTLLIAAGLMLNISMRQMAGGWSKLDQSESSYLGGGLPIFSEGVDQQSYKLVFGGDVMLARSVGDGIVYRNFDPFAGVRDVLLSADLAVINLECVVSDIGFAASKPYTFRAPPAALDTLHAAGIDMVSVANNHAGDYGRTAFVDMLQRLDASSIGYFGGGQNITEAYQPKLVVVGDLTVALLGVSMIETPYFAATDTQPGLAWLDMARLRESVALAKSKADLVIVMPHWGTEYTPQVNLDQQRLGREMIDMGVDLVVGAHTHHVQAVENYNGGVIAYSLGNFIFDTWGPNAGWRRGLLLRVEVSRSAESFEVTSVEQIPINIDVYGAATLGG